MQARDLGQHTSGTQKDLEKRQQGHLGCLCRDVAAARVPVLRAIFRSRCELISGPQHGRVARRFLPPPTPARIVLDTQKTVSRRHSGTRSGARGQLSAIPVVGVLGSGPVETSTGFEFVFTVSNRRSLMNRDQFWLTEDQFHQLTPCCRLIREASLGSMIGGLSAASSGIGRRAASASPDRQFGSEGAPLCIWRAKGGNAIKPLADRAVDTPPKSTL